MMLVKYIVPLDGTTKRKYCSIFVGHIVWGFFLHNPEKLALYVVGTSKLGFWNGHWHNNQQIKLCDPLKLYPCCKP